MCAVFGNVVSYVFISVIWEYMHLISLALCQMFVFILTPRPTMVHITKAVSHPFNKLITKILYNLYGSYLKTEELIRPQFCTCHDSSAVMTLKTHLKQDCFSQDFSCKLINHVMMTSSHGNIFHVTGPWCGEFTGHRWIPRTKACDVELWCFLWFASE